MRATLLGVVLPPAAAVVFLDAVTDYCYQRLLADSSCCRDESPSLGIVSMSVARPGMAWKCRGAPNGFCRDTNVGPRGQDHVWWPGGADCSTPRILYVHGGNWQTQGPLQGSYDVLASKISAETRALIMIPDFRLVPIGNYTDMLTSLLDAWVWLSKHGPGAQTCDGPAVMFVAGDSSGATTALSLLLKLRNHSGLGPSVAGFFAFSPWTNLASDTPTYYTNAFAEILDLNGVKDYVGDILAREDPRSNTDSFRLLAHAYISGSIDPLARELRLLANPAISPLHATPHQLAGLPPMYVAASATESRTSDATILATRAAMQGVPVFLELFYGMWHAFPLYSEGCGSGFSLWQGLAALRHVGDFVRQTAEAVKHNPNLQYFGIAGASVPQTQFYFIHPTGQTPWTPVEPLTLTMQVGASKRATSQTSSTRVATSTSAPVARSQSQSSAFERHAPPAPAGNSKTPNLANPPPAAAVQHRPGWTERPDEEDDPSQQGECHGETLVGAYLAGAAGGALLVLSVLALLLCHRTRALRADPKGSQSLRNRAVAAAQALPQQSPPYSGESSGDSPATVPPISRGPTGLHGHINARFSEVQQPREGTPLDSSTDITTDNDACMPNPGPNSQSHAREGACPGNPCCRRGLNRDRSFGMLGASLPAWIGDGVRADARPLVLHGKTPA
mmetsp:Transcript_44970/g.89018  ORF Transcript_44970/g.89018 Transcript_44970/m.89018 type:complete len:676 (+) Transcript_44970:80-2107(+)